MTLAAEQRPLYDELINRIPTHGNAEVLSRYVGAVLHTLLRRQSDIQFLSAVVDAFTEGLAGRSWSQQRDLAAEVIGVVLEKRPEISLAWQAAHPAMAALPPRRRAADRIEPTAAAPPAPPPYEFADCEAVVAAYLAEVLGQRLAVFQVATPDMPSVSFCHDRPFFLFAPAFAEVVKAFAGGPLLENCRVGLERRVYRHISPEVLADSQACRAFLDGKRPEVWKIISERLAKLAAGQKNGEAKLAQTMTHGGGPGFKEVAVPETRPRLFNVLGVKFQLGSVTTMRTVRVKQRAAAELDQGEGEALGLLARLRYIAIEHGLELPPSADFQVLRTLFEFDTKRFQQAAHEFSALAAHPETSRKYLFERLAYLDQAFSSHLSDILVVMLFREHGNRGFDFDALYDICVGTAKDQSALANKRPFVLMEVARRPRDLAFQLREVLRRRMDDGAIIAATKALCGVFARMSRSRFAHELEAAEAVVAAFPLAFAGDPDEPTLTAIGHLVYEAMTADHIDVAQCVVNVSGAYRRVGRRKTG
jgi:hypothetical protein